jgi:hypothetical protein
MMDASTVNTIITAIPPTLTALAAIGALCVSLWNSHKLAIIKDNTDGVLAALGVRAEKSAGDAARKEGELAGRDYTRAHMEQRADAKAALAASPPVPAQTDPEEPHAGT